MYFKLMPNITYDFNGNITVVKDIFRMVGLTIPQINETGLIKYYIKDGETPEILSQRVYNTPKYHWVILATNQIVNVHEEWPKSDNRLFEYVENKYGIGNATDIHHYAKTINDENIIVDPDSSDSSIFSVSNLAYEREINESKRQISLLKEEYIPRFVSEYKKLLRS